MAGAFTNLLRTHDDPPTGRFVALSGGALMISQTFGHRTDWRSTIDALRERLTAQPALTEHASIRPATKCGLSWEHLDFRLKLPNGLREASVRYNQHLLGRYAYDAHGMQVLTDAHLAKAHDLTGWLVTDLGHGRHLVEAADLAPWYANPLPDRGVLDQARHDFGPMILTEDVIRADKAPFPRPGEFDR